ncbi:MAG: radical SAM protein [Elusimicrobia bacterium]|nr:radical SAM protein [Elusimicrobiota bacterium]
MTQGRGALVGDYQAPLFLAWQLTNRCGARCLHCCEESGPDKAWSDEFTREEALAFARQVVEAGIVDAAFGGGEPLGVPHSWEIFEILHAGGVGLKIETNGLLIGDAEAKRLKDLEAQSIQISIDGATQAVHEKVRPLGDFKKALGAIERLAKLGLEPEFVFVPNKINRSDAKAAIELAVNSGARRFVTGPMMRLGRAAAAWEALGLSPSEWAACAADMKEAAAKHPGLDLSIYPWDIVEEIRVRRQQPQAMVLVVPNGKVKLLNALPFACADLRKTPLKEAWKAYLSAWDHPDVVDFTERVRTDPSLLRHANECWDLAPAGAARR